MVVLCPAGSAAEEDAGGARARGTRGRDGGVRGLQDVRCTALKTRLKTSLNLWFSTFPFVNKDFYYTFPCLGIIPWQGT